MTERERAPGPTNASTSGRVLIWVAAALVVAAGVGLVTLLEKSGRERATGAPVHPAPIASSVPESTAPSETPLHPAAPRAPVVPPRAAAPAVPSALPTTDFFGADAPEALRKMHEVTSSGGLLALPRMKELYQLGKDHPGDGRPHLLMAEDAVNRGWDGFAVSHYERAFREDARARQDPRMLKDLVAIAAGKSEAQKAAKAITEIYGAAAVPAIEEALAAAGDKGDTDRVERLSALSRSLLPNGP